MFGIDAMISKFHWLLHCWIELAIHSVLFACFTHERKHKQIRRFAGPMTNTRSYEKHLLMEITCQQHAELEELGCFSIGPLPPKVRCGAKRRKSLLDILFPGEEVDYDVYVGMTTRVSRLERCSKGDVVIVDNKIARKLEGGIVIMNMEINDVPITLLKALRLRQFSNGAADWDELEEASPWASEDIICSTKWKQVSATVVRTLVPPSLHDRF